MRMAMLQVHGQIGQCTFFDHHERIWLFTFFSALRCIDVPKLPFACDYSSQEYRTNTLGLLYCITSLVVLLAH